MQALSEAIGASIGTINQLLEQIGQMRGMFDDADGTIAEAVDNAEAEVEALERFRTNLKERPPTVVVTIEDGLVDVVTTDTPLLEGVKVLKLDRDTDGADPDDLVRVRMTKGKPFRAYASVMEVELDTAVDVPAMLDELEP